MYKATSSRLFIWLYHLFLLYWLGGGGTKNLLQVLILNNVHILKNIRKLDFKYGALLR